MLHRPCHLLLLSMTQLTSVCPSQQGHLQLPKMMANGTQLFSRFRLCTHSTMPPAAGEEATRTCHSRPPFRSLIVCEILVVQLFIMMQQQQGCCSRHSVKSTPSCRFTVRPVLSLFQALLLASALMFTTSVRSHFLYMANYAHAVTLYTQTRTITHCKCRERQLATLQSTMLLYSIRRAKEQPCL